MPDASICWNAFCHECLQCSRETFLTQVDRQDAFFPPISAPVVVFAIVITVDLGRVPVRSRNSGRFRFYKENNTDK